MIENPNIQILNSNSYFSNRTQSKGFVVTEENVQNSQTTYVRSLSDEFVVGILNEKKALFRYKLQ